MRGGMYKSIVLHERRPEFTRQRFMDHWLNIHAPMSEGAEELYGYVCNEVIEQFTLSAIPAFELQADVDGIAQMWFEQPDGLITLPRQPRVKEWFNDGPNFIGRRMRFVGDEKIVVRPKRLSGSTPKLMLFFVRAENSNADTFRSRIEIAFRSPSLQQLSGSGSTLAHIVDSPTSASVVGFPMPLVDTVAEIWFPELKSAVHAATTVAAELKAMRSLGIGGARAFATMETVIRTPQDVAERSATNQAGQSLYQGSTGR